MLQEKNYTRRYLRAPFRCQVLFNDDGFVSQASASNLSEGGMLLQHVPHFPDEHDNVSIMLSIPQFPYFKNYTLEQLKMYSQDLSPANVLRVRASLVRQEKDLSNLDLIFSRIGLKFIDLSQEDQKIIANYVDVFASNLIQLQILIDTIHSSENQLEKIRILSGIIGYDQTIKVSILNKLVQRDYMSLQWL